MKSEKEQEHRSLRERIVHRFEKFGVENIMYAIADTTAWSNSVDFIFPKYDKEWYVIGMEAGILNLGTGEYERLGFAEKQDFLDFMDELMAADTNKYPDLQKYYKLAKEKIAGFERYK